MAINIVLTLNTPQWKYNRLSIRTDQFLDRYEGTHAEIAVWGPTLRPLTASYRGQYVDIDVFERHARYLTKTGKAEVKVLSVYMQNRVPLLALHVSDFDVTPLIEAVVEDDVIGQGHRLAEILRFLQQDGVPDSGGAEQILLELEPLVQRAETAWNAAQQALAELQEKREALRQTTLAINQALVAFRRVVRRTLGARHRDYQKLLVGNVRKSDPNDELDPIEPPAAVEPSDPPAAGGLADEQAS